MGGARNFPRGADPVRSDLKYGFQGTGHAKHLRKNGFRHPMGGYNSPRPLLSLSLICVVCYVYYIYIHKRSRGVAGRAAAPL